MTGVVLCGGQSTRMGSDKGLLQHQSVSWAQLAVKKMSTLNIPVVLSVNDQQYALYKSIFTDTLVLKDENNLDIGGPLKGIVSVHKQFPEDDLFILACDMVNMHEEALNNLAATRAIAINDLYVYLNDDDVVETMCGIYTSKGLKKVSQIYIDGQLKKHSLHNIAKMLDTFLIPVSKEWKKYFHNFNSPRDLDAL